MYIVYSQVWGDGVHVPVSIALRKRETLSALKWSWSRHVRHESNIFFNENYVGK